MTQAAAVLQTPELSVNAIPEKASTTQHSRTRIYVRNATAGVARMLVNALVALALPGYIAHLLPVNTYSAWLLVLQLSAYITYLDLGVQTGVSKFIAEYMQRVDCRGCSMAATAGFRILLGSASFGLPALPLLAWVMPRLFHSLPSDLLFDARSGVLLIGFSLIVSLVCSIFPAIFLGLQRYEVPSTLAIVNKLLYGVAVACAVKLHSSMVTMGAVVALINLLTALAQVLVWRRKISWVQVNVSLQQSDLVPRMLRYCSVLTLWSVGMLCVGGLDLILVGDFDFHNTAYYAIAAAPSTFLIVLLSAALGPLLPAVSALSVKDCPARIGELLLSVTRFATVMLSLTGLPLILWGGPFLRLWVGPVYAVHSLPILRVLIAANLVRNLLGPYSTFVIAVGRQRAATLSAMTEAVLNLVCSILLARRMGAIGVAAGTLLGAIAGVAVHLALSMRYTSAQIDVRRSLFIARGLLRPLILIIPCGLVLLVGDADASRRILIAPAWCISSLALAWFVCLESPERLRVRNLLNRIRTAAGVQA